MRANIDWAARVMLIAASCVMFNLLTVGGTCAAAAPLVVSTTFFYSDEIMGDTTPLAVYCHDDATGVPVASLEWGVDAGSWFFVGEIEVKGSLLLDTDAPTKVATSQHPITNHMYRALMSYDPAMGVLFVRVSDETAGSDVMSGIFRAKTDLSLYSEASAGEDSLVMVSHEVEQKVVPVGATWEFVERGPQGYVPVLGRRMLKEPAPCIRLSTLGAQLGGSFFLQTADRERPTSLLQTSDTASTTFLGPLDLPLGVSMVELFYTDEMGEVWSMGSREAETVEATVYISLTRPKQQNGYLENEISFRADGPLTVTLSVDAYLDQPRWENGYDDQIEFAVGEIDLSREWQHFPLRIPVRPDQAKVLRVNFKTSLIPAFETSVEGEEHYLLVEP
jgi:hypothetical protein